MANLVEGPVPQFKDANGEPLEDGFLYFGEPGFNPQTSPKQVYCDAELLIPANQVRTKNGFPSYQGSPGRIYSDGNYSIQVNDKNQRTIYINLDTIDYLNSASGSTVSSVPTIADLRAIEPRGVNLQVSVGGSVTEGDGLMGPVYYWDPDATAADNGVSVIQPSSVTGDGRWLWVNTNAPTDTVNIDASGALSLGNINKIFLVDTDGGAISLTVPDGDFQGQEVALSNDGGNTLTINGTGIPTDTFVTDNTFLKWVNAQWSIPYVSGGGDLDVSGDLTVTGLISPSAGVTPTLVTTDNAEPIGTLYTILSPYIPNVNDEIIINGSINNSTGTSPTIYQAASVYRFSATELKIRGLTMVFAGGSYTGGSASELPVASGGGGTYSWVLAI